MKNKYWIVLITFLTLSCISGTSFAETPNRTGLSLSIGGSFGGARTVGIADLNDYDTLVRRGRWGVIGGANLGVGYGLGNDFLVTLTGYWGAQQRKLRETGETLKAGHTIDVLLGLNLYIYQVFINEEIGFGSMLIPDIKTNKYLFFPGALFRTSLGYEIPLSNIGLGIGAYYSYGIYRYSSTEGARLSSIGLTAYLRLY